MRRVILSVLAACLGASVIVSSQIRPVPGGGSGGGANVNGTYLVKTATNAPANAQVMGSLGSGLVINTTTTGVQSIFGGASCTNQGLTALSAAGAATCTTLTSAYVDSSVATVAAANVFSSATGQSVKKLLFPGSSSGTLTVLAAATAGTSTLTLPGGTTDFSATGGTGQVVQQGSAGGAFTVGTLTTLGAFPITTSNVTSGGLAYFSSPTAMASSALIAAHNIVLANGAAAAPTGIAGGTNCVLFWTASSSDPSCSASPSLTTVTATTINANTTYQHNGVTFAAGGSQPANPTGTTSTGGVMMGLAGSFVPSGSKVYIVITGIASNSIATDGALVYGRYGTGSAPANAGADTGTAFGRVSGSGSIPVANEAVDVTVQQVVTGLTPGTTYWVDLFMQAVLGGTATIGNIQITTFDLP